MNISPFVATFPNEKLIPSFDSFLKSAKQKYPQYLDTGFYERTKKEGLYIHEIKSQNLSIRGLITATNIQDLVDRKALKHEETIATKEQETLDYLMERKAYIKPVLLAHKSDEAITTFKNQHCKRKNLCLSFSLTSGVEHRLYAITDLEQIKSIKKHFKKKIDKSYIADGHHKSAASKLLYHQNKHWDKIMTAYFDLGELEIWEYNRIINGLNQITATQFMAKLSAHFDISYVKKPKRIIEPFTYNMYMHREWYTLTLRPETLELWSKKYKPLITTTILDKLILEQIFNVKDVRFDDRIKYVSGKQSYKHFEWKVESLLSNVGFCFGPVSKTDFVDVADKGDVLPPKSTWFEPRMINGFITMEL